MAGKNRKTQRGGGDSGNQRGETGTNTSRRGGKHKGVRWRSQNMHKPKTRQCKGQQGQGEKNKKCGSASSKQKRPSAGLSIGQQVNGLVGQSVRRAVNRTMNKQSVGQSVDRLVSWPVTSSNQSVKPSDRHPGRGCGRWGSCVKQKCLSLPAAVCMSAFLPVCP